MVAMLFVTLTLFAPLLDKVIAPVKAFPAFVKVMALAPALKLEVPGTVIAPLSVIAPEEVMLKF